VNISFDEFRKRIELSMISHILSEEEVRINCEKAVAAKVGVICVNPPFVALSRRIIGNKKIDLSVNVGFPFGSYLTETKVIEAKQGIRDGANQIDMVINVGALRSGKDNEVLEDIKAVVKASPGCLIKVIIESWVLNENEKIRACSLVEKAGAHLVKTTTGVKTQYIKQFCKCNEPKGATVEDITLFRRILGPHMRIKASGGVYMLDDAFEMIKAGADQLGVSRGIELIAEFKEKYKEGIEI
jgi:deoxyribose-phosphate aldolase